MFNDEYSSSVNTENPQPERYSSYNVEERYPTVERERVKKKSAGGFLKKAFGLACGGLCFGLFAGIGLYAVTQVTDFNLSEAPSVITPVPQISTVDTTNNTIQKDNLVMNAVITSDVSDMVEDVILTEYIQLAHHIVEKGHGRLSRYLFQ